MSLFCDWIDPDINILHIFQNMKDLLCPKFLSLVNYSVSFEI